MKSFTSKLLLIFFIFSSIFTSVDAYALNDKFEYKEKYDYSYRLKMFEEDIVNYYIVKQLKKCAEDSRIEKSVRYG